MDERSDMDCSRDAGIIARSATLASDQEGFARAHAANGSSTEAWSNLRSGIDHLTASVNIESQQRQRPGPQ